MQGFRYPGFRGPRLGLQSGVSAWPLSLEVLRLARNLPPGAIMVDAGVFDGTDWSLMGILAGATVIGISPWKSELEGFL